jgi:hypothetical protein
MIKSNDLIHLPYTPDLTEAGIAYACRSLVSLSGRLGGSLVNNLQCIVAEVAGGLALRRNLAEQGIPFGVLGAAPFSHPPRYDLCLGGHPCNVKNFLITRRVHITLIRKDPALLLKAPALLPLDQFAADGHRPDELYLFAFILGVVAATLADTDRASAAGQPIGMIHPLPKEWAQPALWLPVEKLVLKSECETPISVEIGGQDAGREFVNVRLELPPRQRVPVEQCFHSLAYIQASKRPMARIGLHSPTRGEAYIIPVHGWSNLWVYGMDIFLAGWLCHDEYRRKARVLNAGMHSLQFERTRVKNLLVPVGELNPMRPLLDHVKEWEKERTDPKNEETIGSVKTSETH